MLKQRQSQGEHVEQQNRRGGHEHWRFVEREPPRVGCGVDVVGGIRLVLAREVKRDVGDPETLEHEAQTSVQIGRGGEYESHFRIVPPGADGLVYGEISVDGMQVMGHEYTPK